MRIYAKKVEADGYKFDSEMEYNYYLELKQRQKDGTIKNLEIHTVFELQPEFTKAGKKWKAIHYEADFVFFDNLVNKKRIVDVKGMVLPEFEIHRKMFEYKYKDYDLEVLKYSKTTGWVSIDDYKKTMRSKRQLIRQERTAYKNKLERLSFLNKKILLLKSETNLSKGNQKRLEAYEKEIQEIIRS